MAILLRKAETILVKSIARMGYKDIEAGGSIIEKVAVDREPCEAMLRHVKHMRGVSRVTLPVGTWMHKEGNKQ